MAETLSLETRPRGDLGSANSRRLRRSGLIPAVLYGKKVDNVNLAVSREAFETILRHHGRVLDVVLPDGRVEKAMIREVQYDPFGEEVLHVDLGRVALDEKIHVTVPLVLTGDPVGVAKGGHLEVNLHELEIECLAGAIPDNIKVSIAAMELDQQMRVKEIPVPEGVKILEGEDVVVVHVAPPRLEEPVPGVVAPEAATGAEPEVIAKGKKEEEEEGEEK